MRAGRANWSRTIRGLRPALASPAPEVRRVALAAWLDPDRKELPPLAIELRRDPDPRVRATALEVLAVQRPKPAETLLLAALDDTDLSVRIAAIGALGKLGTPAARSALENCGSHSHEAARVESVRALYKMAGYQAVIASAHDKSWRVRQAVAESLSQAGKRQPERRNVELARSLVHDPSLDVQRQMIQSLAAWPLPPAGAVLLSAMAEAGYQTRKDAAAAVGRSLAGGGRISGRSAGAGTSHVDRRAFGPLEERVCASWRWRRRMPRSKGRRQRICPAKELARLRRLIDACGDGRIVGPVRQTAIDSLVAYGAAAAGGARVAGVCRSRRRCPRRCMKKSCPRSARCSPRSTGWPRATCGCGAVGPLQLSSALAAKPMTQLALDRLVVLARRETDPVVWQSLLQTTASDARPGAVQLAYLAVGNSSSDVRRRACDYLAAHADPRHAAVLLPMLEDPSSTVVIAAVRGLGAIGTLDDPRPLVGLLLTPDRRVAARGGRESGAIESRRRPCGTCSGWRSIPTCRCGWKSPSEWANLASRSSCRR